MVYTYTKLFCLCLLALLLGCSSSQYLQSNELPQTIENKATLDNIYSNKEPNSRRDEVVLKIAKLYMKSRSNWTISKRVIGNDDLSNVFFVNENNGWLVSIKGDEIVPEGGNIYKTINGGKSWTKLKVRLPQESYISNIYFLDQSRGWIVVQTLENQNRNIDTQIQVLETLNGGKSWKILSSQKNAFVSKIVFNNSGEGWIVGLKGKATYSYNADALALHTFDFGKTWTDVSPKFVTENKDHSKQVLLTSDSLKDIYSIGETIAVILSRGGEILRTDNGGRSWKKEMQLMDEKYSLGFQKLVPLRSSEFMTISRAGGPEGTWSLFTTFKEKTVKDKYLLNGVFISDLERLSDDQIIACGLKNDINNDKTRIDSGNLILISKSLGNWEEIYKSSEECSSSCGFNEMAKISDDKFFFVGKNGTLVSITKK